MFQAPSSFPAGVLLLINMEITCIIFSLHTSSLSHVDSGIPWKTMLFSNSLSSRCFSLFPNRVFFFSSLRTLEVSTLFSLFNSESSSMCLFQSNYRLLILSCMVSNLDSIKSSLDVVLVLALLLSLMSLVEVSDSGFILGGVGSEKCNLFDKSVISSLSVLGGVFLFDVDPWLIYSLSGV